MSLTLFTRLVLLWSQHYQPPVTFVVVQKRHHTSFVFANNHNDHQTIDRSGNILPGTMVDSKICHPTEFDFYFCSHAVFRAQMVQLTITCYGMRTSLPPNNLCYTPANFKCLSFHPF